MVTELKLSLLQGSISRYSIITIVFFATYTVFQPPATVIVRYLGPRSFLSAIVVAWGAVMIGMGFAPGYGTMVALRVVLGILEAGFFPSCVYLLSTWCTSSRSSKSYPSLTNMRPRHSLRHWQALLLLLHSWQCGIIVRRYPGLRNHATQRTRGSEWVEMYAIQIL